MERKLHLIKVSTLFYFCLICLTNGSHNSYLSVNPTEGLWAHYEGYLMSNAWRGGSHRKNREPTYVCRVKEADGSLRPGKHAWDCCFVSNGTDEIRIYDFDILVKESDVTLAWVKTNDGSFPENPLIGGFKAPHGRQLFLCRFPLPVYELCSPSNKCKHSLKIFDGGSHSHDDIVNGYYEYDVGKCVVTWGGAIYSSWNNIEILTSSSGRHNISSTGDIHTRGFLLQGHREIPERVYFEPLVTFPKTDESIKRYLDALHEFPKVYRGSLSSGNVTSKRSTRSVTGAIKEIIKIFYNIGRFLRSEKMKTEEQKKMELYIKQEINHLEVKLTLEDASAKLCSVMERLIQILNSTSSYEDTKLEIVPSLHTMDELYEKFSDENYSLWQYPLITAPYYLVYINLHSTLCKIAPKILVYYDEFCFSKRQQVSILLLKFSSWFIEKRSNLIGEKDPNYFSKEGTWPTFKSLGYCYAKGTFCGGAHFHVIDDPYDENFRPKGKGPGYYTFRNYDPTGIYKTQIQIIYSDYFNKYVDFSIANQTLRTQRGQISDTCHFENPRYSRIECGWGGITKQQCESRNCCYDESTSNVKWCFKGNNQETDTRIDDEKERTQPKTLSTCVFDFPLNRTNCGHHGISKKDCESKGCCHDPKFSQQQGQTIYVCFKP